jgi:hypothetical protein
MKHRIGRGLTVVAVAGITFFYPLLAPTPHRIDEAHLKMIRNGMSLAEVESIFGVPPGEDDSAEWDLKAAMADLEQTEWRITFGNFNPYVVSCIAPIDSIVLDEELKRRKKWVSCNGSFSVQLDTSGLVSSTWHSKFVRIVPPWERLRRFLKSDQ